MSEGAAVFVIGSIISITLSVILILLVLWGRGQA